VIQYRLVSISRRLSVPYLTKSIVGFCKLVHLRGVQCSKVGNEGTVKVAESKEAANFLYSSGCWPVGDSFDFDWVHPNFAIANDYPQIFHFLLMEVAFLWFKEEVVLR
jgi:hypothetical protein